MGKKGKEGELVGSAFDQCRVLGEGHASNSVRLNPGKRPPRHKGLSQRIGLAQDKEIGDSNLVVM